MSKHTLHRIAGQKSGMSHEESERAVNLIPSVCQRIGQEAGFRQLSTLLYDRVFADDDAQWFLGIFSSSTKEEAIDNQHRFFAQTFGGPDLHRQKKGKHTRLVGRHANYNVGTNAAHRWVQHMELAIDEHDQLKDDSEARDALKKYFGFTAHYIVASMEYMRSDQLSGGTSIDSGRVW